MVLINIFEISDVIRFNEQILEEPILYSKINLLIGQPSRVVEKVNKILIYDNDGIFLYTKDEKVISQISVIFSNPGWIDHAPRNIYSDKLIIEGIEIKSLNDFYKFSDEFLDRDEEEGEGIIHLNLESLSFSVQFDIETKQIIEISFWYS